MTSPLQAAHDQAADAEPEAAPVICTVATPRTSAMTGVYLGEELRARCSRPGAYDAMALPSLMGGQKRDPLAPRSAAPRVPRAETKLSPHAVTPLSQTAFKKSGPVREFPTVHRVPGEYRPRPGSAPSKVIDHLRAFGGFISHAEIAERFDVVRNAITAIFKPALERGVLMKQVVGGYVGFSLPGWTAPNTDELGASAEARPMRIIQTTGHADFLGPQNGNRRFWPIETHQVTPLTKEEATDVRAFLNGIATELLRRPGGPEAPAVDEFDPEQMSALYELSLREAELGQLRRYIAVLELRMQITDLARLFPLPPLTEPPRLTTAA